MKGLIDEVKKAGNIILVIDEVHNIMGAGEAEGSMNAANILKPALSRGEIQVIGATTLKEYRKFIEKDSALERRFQPVFVNEPSVQETIDILKGIKVHYEVYHKVRMLSLIHILIDPEIIVRPVEGQIDDLIGEIRQITAKGQRVLVTTLTKKMAESLTEYLGNVGIRVRYLHSDIKSIERMEIIKDLRTGVFDVLVGINLLREGLDLPEVSLVAILDADKAGFLRSETSLKMCIRDSSEA